MKMGKRNKGGVNLLLLVGVIMVVLFAVVLFVTVSKVTDQDKKSGVKTEVLKESKASTATVAEEIDKIVKPHNYGNGVYCFRTAGYGVSFGDSLSLFLEQNKELEIIAIASFSSQGGTDGYFVITRPKK